VVGSENPLAKEYEIVKDEGGFLVSRKINQNLSDGSIQEK